MQHDWMIDVLADLSVYAHLKGLAASAAALEDASLVVMAELSSGTRVRTNGPSVVETYEDQPGHVIHLFAGGKRA